MSCYNRKVLLKKVALDFQQVGKSRIAVFCPGGDPDLRLAVKFAGQHTGVGRGAPLLQLPDEGNQLSLELQAQHNLHETPVQSPEC